MKDDKIQETKEMAQQKALLKETVEILSNNAWEKEKSFKQLDVKCEIQSRKLKELEQQKIIGSEMSDWQEKKTQRAKIIYLLFATVTVSASIGFLVFFYNSHGDSLRASPQFLNNYNSNYVVQNLQGDTVDTWVSWNIANDRVIHVHVVNEAKVSQDLINAVQDAILSTKVVSIDDSKTGKGPQGTSSTYYVGWKGAVETASSDHMSELYIPQRFDISGSPDGVGDIEIVLTSDVNPDGYSGWTKSIVDGNQILKSKITIFKVNTLDADRLEAVIRHEFGHALGLGHSTASEDLMHYMLPDYPYISGCDVDALKGLYDGDKNSKVICKK